MRGYDLPLRVLSETQSQQSALLSSTATKAFLGKVSLIIF